jgi:hypothetical protein
MAFHFGIRPWEIDSLTIDQFYAFCDALDEIAKKASE